MRRKVWTTLLLPALLLMGCQEQKVARWTEDPKQQKEVFLADTVFAKPVEPEVGAANLQALRANYQTQADFDARKTELRREMLYQVGLEPMPKQPSLNPVVTGKQEREGYTIENVALEILPGVWTYGNLYRPTTAGKHPAVLLAHGHGPTEISERCPRFSATYQTIAASLARMGAVVFNYSMFAYAESGEQLGAVHRIGLAQTMNTLGSLSILDYLETLPDVDPSRIAMTGQSGGGTQTFIATALDDRIAVSVPVTQVSCFFPGGCPCESGRPLHLSVTPNTNNAEIAATTVPRPLLVISDGKDWTRTNDQVEFPFIQSIYSLYGMADRTENVHLPEEGHDYGPSKRTAMYNFLAKHLGLNKAAITNADGFYDESFVVLATPESLLVFNHDYPQHSLQSAEAVYDRLRQMQE